MEEETFHRKQKDGSLQYVKGYFVTKDQLVRMLTERLMNYEAEYLPAETFVELWLKREV